MVINCSICSIWSFTEAEVSRPGTTMSLGSVVGCHLADFGSIGFKGGVIVEPEDALSDGASREV